VTLEETHDRQKTTTLIGLQILIQIKPVEEVGAKLVERAVNQPIAEDQANLGLQANISRMKCSFQGGDNVTYI
jgi:hypothetical protein